MADLPWNKKSEEVLDIQRAKQQLENDHYGQVYPSEPFMHFAISRNVSDILFISLDHVKKRIIEYLSVIKIKGDLKAPIICFVGPVRSEMIHIHIAHSAKLECI